MRRRVVTQRMNAQVLTDFPRLTIKELRNVTLGMYQNEQKKFWY